MRPILGMFVRDATTGAAGSVTVSFAPIK